VAPGAGALELINCLRVPKISLRVGDTKQSSRVHGHIHVRLSRTGRLLGIAFTFGFALHMMTCIYWALIQYEWGREQDHDGDLYASASFNKSGCRPRTSLM
jgi:hypothetical protein